VEPPTARLGRKIEQQSPISDFCNNIGPSPPPAGLLAGPLSGAKPPRWPLDGETVRDPELTLQIADYRTAH
jgi:hypothetical protein